MNVVVRWVVRAGLCAGLLSGCEAGARPHEQVERTAEAAPPQALAATASRPRAPRLSSEELLLRLRARLSRPDGALRVEQGPDGTRRVALDGHLQHATLAVTGADGRVHTTCVDNPAAAARALGLDASAAVSP